MDGRPSPTLLRDAKTVGAPTLNYRAVRVVSAPFAPRVAAAFFATFFRR